VGDAWIFTDSKPAMKLHLFDISNWKLNLRNRFIHFVRLVILAKDKFYTVKYLVGPQFNLIGQRSHFFHDVAAFCHRGVEGAHVCEMSSFSIPFHVRFVPMITSNSNSEL